MVESVRDMGTPVEARSLAFSIGERIWPQVDIETDAACEPLLTDCPDNLGLVVMELVQNCTQKPHNGDPVHVDLSMRATDDGMYVIRVADNVMYPDETLKLVMKNLRRKHPAQIETCCDPDVRGGNIGITAVRNYAANNGGTLEYEANDGSVVAILTVRQDLVHGRESS